MARKLFTVQDSFQIEERGLLLLPGIVPLPGERFCEGNLVEVKLPDGSTQCWPINVVLMHRPHPSDELPIILRSDSGRADIPISSEVWSVDDNLPR